jgi:hypothetical protein
VISASCSASLVASASGSGLSGSSQSSAEGCQWREVEVDRPTAPAHLGLDHASGPLGLIAAAGREKDPRSVPGDDDAVVEGLAQIVLQLAGVEAFGQRVGMPFLAQVNL